MSLHWFSQVRGVQGGGERFGLRSVEVSMGLDVHQIERSLLGVFDLSSDEDRSSANAPHGLCLREFLQGGLYAVFLDEP